MTASGRAAARRFIPALRRSRASATSASQRTFWWPRQRRKPNAGAAAFASLPPPAASARSRPGRDVGRDERRLDGQRARPAQRVQQAGTGGGVARPRRVQQHAGGEVLLERRLDLHLVGAVPAPVQALPAQVDRDGHARAREVRVHAHVRRARIDRGTGAAGGAELVHDRVLDAHGAEAGVPDAVVDAGEVDRQGVAGAEVLAPVDAAGRGVQLVAVGRLPGRQRQQDASADPRPQAGAVRGLERA